MYSHGTLLVYSDYLPEGWMATHVFSELDLCTSTKFPAKFVKRPHNDDKGITNLTENQSLSYAAATKRSRDAAVTSVSHPMPLPFKPCVNNSYVVNRSEVVAFFSLLGTFNIYNAV